jgi:hypothetical protein
MTTIGLDDLGTSTTLESNNPSMWPQLSSPFESFFVFSCLCHLPPVRIKLGRAYIDSVHAWAGCPLHSPCDCLRLMWIAHVPYARGPIPLLSRLLTDSRGAGHFSL